MATRLIAKLRYMGRQYSAGQVARGGEGQKHYLEEAADTLETQAACIAELEAKNAELATAVVEKNLQINALTEVSRELANEKLVTESLRYQLSAGQAREKMLREGMYNTANGCRIWGGEAERARKMLEQYLALPQDTTALDELLAKERERICNVMELQLSERQRGIIRSLK